MKLRIFTLSLIIGLSLLTNCKSDDDTKIAFESTAIISRFDLSLCACCGGWIINIDGQQSNNRFTELPQDSNIDLDTTTFPISVNLNWTESEDYCGQGILVEAIALTE
jgi:hypothetical protein